jgi:stalled ribosome rescue protein Dom34
VTEHYHAIVWIDHHEARVFHFNSDESDAIVVHPRHPTQHIHHKANAIGSGHASEDQDFFGEVVSAIGGAGAILLTGPANAKHELVKHIQRWNPKLMERVAGIETLDHPTDGVLLAHARKFFKAADRMRAQTGQ